MEPGSVALEDALRLLSLPRSLGTEPGNEEPIFADIGRYGPYIKRGTDTRSLKSPEEALEITLEAAIEVLKQEKPKAGWRSRAPKVIRELGNAPKTETPLQILDGRYGPYVSDGEINASLPRGRKPEELTVEEAMGLIREREASGKGRRKAGKKKTAKKKTAKKATAKKATAKKKTAAKKTAKKASTKAPAKKAATKKAATKKAAS